MSEVPGCGNSMEFYDWLAKTLPPESTVVEVGVFYGRGLVHLAKVSDFRIYGVDPFKVENMPYHPGAVDTDEAFHDGCLRNLLENGVDGRVTLIPLPSVEAAMTFGEHTLDCVFIDADHSYESVITDIAAWRDKVKPGGYLAGDDYVSPWGVIQAVDEVFPNRLLMGQTWYVQL